MVTSVRPPDRWNDSAEQSIREANEVLLATELLLSERKASPVVVSRTRSETPPRTLSPRRLYQNSNGYNSLRVGGPCARDSDPATPVEVRTHHEIAVNVCCAGINLALHVDLSQHVYETISVLRGVFLREQGVMPVDHGDLEPMALRLFTGQGWHELCEPLEGQVSEGAQLLLIEEGASTFPSKVPLPRTPSAYSSALQQPLDAPVSQRKERSRLGSCTLPHLQGVREGNDSQSLTATPVSKPAGVSHTTPALRPASAAGPPSVQRSTPSLVPAALPPTAPSEDREGSSVSDTSSVSIDEHVIAMTSSMCTIHQQDQMIKTLLLKLEDARVTIPPEKVHEGYALQQSPILKELESMEVVSARTKTKRDARKNAGDRSGKASKKAAAATTVQEPSSCVCFVKAADQNMFNKRALCLEKREGVHWIIFRTADSSPQPCIEVDLASITTFAYYNDGESAAMMQDQSVYVATATLAWVLVITSSGKAQEWVSWVAATVPGVDSEPKKPPLPVPPVASPSPSRDRRSTGPARPL